MDEPPNSQRPPSFDRQHRPVLGGYRQGIIVVITVLLDFEASGKWVPGSIVAAGTLVLAVLLQIIELVRSLRLEDDDPKEYRKTVA